MKNSNVTLGGGDFYSGLAEVIKGGAFFNLRVVAIQSSER
jgi:hypothetical protein